MRSSEVFLSLELMPEQVLAYVRSSMIQESIFVMKVKEAAVVLEASVATYRAFMNSSLPGLMDSLTLTPAGRFQMKMGASRSLEMLRLRRYFWSGGIVQVERSQVLRVWKVKSWWGR